MTFDDILEQALEMLKRRGRVSYRALKAQFQLDDDLLDVLKEEIIDVHQLGHDQDGRMLVWTVNDGDGGLCEPATPSSESIEQTASDETSSSQTRMPQRDIQTPEAERRQLTVMFCDLVDSTRLAGQLDPEDLREVVRAYQERAAGVIQQYEGHIAQYLGDGLLVYFGWPRAHEDDTHRAVHTGLGIVEAVDDLNTTLEPDHGVQLAVRLGIHTGPVVVGEMGGGDRHENLALGETPNIAARLEGLAQPGTVVMSEATRRLVVGAFDYDDLGRQDLKGVNAAISVFRVRGVSAATSRFEARTTTLTPIVGREVEVDLMMRCWEHAVEGEGQVVLLNGPPGIGKSRLLQTLSSHLAETPHVRLRYQCSPYHINSALYPITTQVTREMKLPPDATSAAKLERLEALVTQTGLRVEEAVPLFAEMLSIPAADRYPPLGLNPQRQKERTLELFAQGVVNLAQQKPVLFCFEDVHWSDPTSLEALSLIIDQVQDARVLVVLTYRPEFEPAWRDDRHITTYTLNRLSRRQTVSLVEHVTRGKALPAEVLDQIVDKTDGIPLFVEELTKHVVESEWLMDAGESYQLTSSLPPLAIPETLQDSLMARLDRLTSVKEAVQLGAAIGREFTYGLLRALSPLSDTALQEALGQLLEAELISQRGSGLESTYNFKHALIQDAAYQSMLRSTRQQVHQAIAQVLETEFAETVETQPELVAHHYTEAGLAEPAIRYWQSAGEHAHARLAYQESVGCFDRALHVLSTLSETRETQQLAIDLRIALRNPLHALGDLDRVLETLRDATGLAEALGDPHRLGQVSALLANCFLMRGESVRALEPSQRAFDSATTSGDTQFQIRANFYMAQAQYGLGDYRRAIEILQENLALRDSERGRERMGITIGTVTVSHLLVWCHAEIGDFAMGATYAEEAVRVAEAADHLYARLQAYFSRAVIALRQGDCHHAVLVLEQALGLCQDGNPALWFIHLSVDLAMAYAMAGRTVEAVPMLESAIAQATAMNFLTHQALWGTYLGEAYRLAGRLEDAFQIAGRALDHARDRRQQGHEAYALRLFGDIAMHHNPPDLDQAETHYHQALTLANELGMRPLQAHCHHGLGTLYRQTGQAKQARGELSTAIKMYRDMEMTFWLPETEAALAAVEGH